MLYLVFKRKIPIGAPTTKNKKLYSQLSFITHIILADISIVFSRSSYFRFFILWNWKIIEKKLFSTPIKKILSICDYFTIKIFRHKTMFSFRKLIYFLYNESSGPGIHKLGKNKWFTRTAPSLSYHHHIHTQKENPWKLSAIYWLFFFIYDNS